MNTLPSSETSQTLPPQKTSVFNTFAHSLLEILDPTQQEEYENFATELQSLLEEFEASIQEQINRTQYTYGDYKERWCVPETQVQESIVQTLWMHRKLQKLYEKILSLTSTSMLTQCVRDRLCNGLLSELAIVEMPEPPVSKMYMLEYHWGDLEHIIAKLKNVISMKSLDFGKNTLHNGTPEQLKELSRLLRPLHSLSLINTQINLLQENDIETLFGNLPNLKYLDLGANHDNVSAHQAYAPILSRLPQLKGLSLEFNELGILSSTILGRIFQHLSGLKYLSLLHNNLGQASNETLESIFSPLANLQSLHLGKNGFGNLSDEQIHAIFGHLPNLQNLTLTETCPYRERLRTLYPRLMGKIIYREHE